MVITDLETFMLDNAEDRIFRFLVHRKIFTPYEQEEKFPDESVYEDGGYFKFGRLEEAIDLGYGEWLLGFKMVDDCTWESFDTIEYYKLSDIRISYFYDEKKIKDEFYDEEDDESSDSLE